MFCMATNVLPVLCLVKSLVCRDGNFVDDVLVLVGAVVGVDRCVFVCAFVCMCVILGVIYFIIMALL